MEHRVLLVDDDPNVLTGLTRVLRKEPYDTLTAQSAEEAIEILKTTGIDVVISDQEMPGMTGTDFLGYVDKHYPDTIRFMLTGNASLQVAIDAINRGAITRFFTKPCNEVDLAMSICQALQHKDLMTEAWRLLQKVKRQDAILERLERESPGITAVEADEDGIFDLDGAAGTDYDQLIEELRSIQGSEAGPEERAPTSGKCHLPDRE